MAPRSTAVMRLCALAAAAFAAWQHLGQDSAFLPGQAVSSRVSVRSGKDLLAGQEDTNNRPVMVIRHAAKKSSGEPIKHGDTVYIKVMTGRYVGEIDGTTKLEWVKARGTKKDKEHALTIEKMGDKDEPIQNGDTVMFVMPTGVHLDVLGSAVRARYYDPRGQWQKITIVKQDGGPIYAGDQIFLRGHQGEYMDANPLERAPDGEVKARWRDEGEWQVMWIEK
eukprot:TRINITY_DN483_c0_g3_i2.p1 TRINITY_DN483_c0_g3~~TRINITY_DN483_c0_g3_i2.p1  ORF type:complete len:223 (+),score=51.53 TRINITY_DN483_c0_g3_i2:64-732(+)